MSGLRLVLFAITALACLCRGQVHGDTLAWLDFDGKIQGDATDSKHADWIEIESFGFNAGRAGSVEGETGYLSKLSLIKALDQSSPMLFEGAVTGETYDEVTIDFNSGPDVARVRIELGKVIISSLSMNASTTALSPTETLDLNFTTIRFTYYTAKSNEIYASYDSETDTGSSGEQLKDTDSDGMPDSWELLYGLSVGVNDAASDLDGDGLSNLDEYELGTDPSSGSSFFQAVLKADPSIPGNYLLSWNSVAGKTYVIEWSPDLKTAFTTIRIVTATDTTTVESITGAGSIGFYRVRPES
ncbi:type VI secretion system tube protein Hcp [Luteolibacter pohnpeiensis]|uniref:Type VI secretion system tube protein Hcp n=1 Tax=Luteolibacter pohnpeiensis TaxID=454153 RepID=A0A934S9T7_9BACT|nr:type VI secretion system tube protein Hcp [Luteolibacter pohnpeiensis]MBK1882282.1 type VI secretion system tube protein Hcp [Luteolibacter pohnpeiensis]